MSPVLIVMILLLTIRAKNTYLEFETKQST